MDLKNSNHKLIIAIVSVASLLLLLAVISGVGIIVNNLQSSSGYITSEQAVDSYSYGGVTTKTFGIGAENRDSATSPITYNENIDLGNNIRLTTENYNYNIESLDVKKTISDLESFVTSNNGIVVNSSLSQRNSNITGNMYVAVPRSSVDNFKSLISDLSSKIINSNRFGNDITDQYTDLNRMLTQLEQTQIKLQSIYDQATTVEDLLDVQNALVKNLNQIDSIKGQLKNSEERSQITYFNLSISTDDLALPIAEQKKWQPLAVAKDSLRNLVQGLQGFVNGLIIFIITILPLLVIYLLPFVLIGWVVYRLTKRKTKNNGNE